MAEELKNNNDVDMEENDNDNSMNLVDNMNRAGTAAGRSMSSFRVDPQISSFFGGGGGGKQSQQHAADRNMMEIAISNSLRESLDPRLLLLDNNINHNDTTLINNINNKNTNNIIAHVSRGDNKNNNMKHINNQHVPPLPINNTTNSNFVFNQQQQFPHALQPGIIDTCNNTITTCNNTNINNNNITNFNINNIINNPGSQMNQHNPQNVNYNNPQKTEPPPRQR